MRQCFKFLHQTTSSFDVQQQAVNRQRLQACSERRSHYSKLQQAARNGDVSTVEMFLQDPAAFSSLPWHFQLKDEGEDEDEGVGWYFYGVEMMSSPLHLSVREGHVEVLQKIVDFFHKSKVLDKIQSSDEQALTNLVETWFKCLLEWAVRWGHAAVLERLLKRPFLVPTRIEARIKIDLPVHLAAHCKHLDALKLLLQEAKKDRNLSEQRLSEDGLTALHLAAQSGSSCIVEFLLNSENKDVNESSDADLFRPLHIAANYGHEDVISLLLHSLNPTDPQGVQNWRVDLLAKDRMGRTALHYAAREGHHRIVQLLLDCPKSGIEGIPDHDGLLPLHMAARAGHVQVIKVLMRHYPDGINSVARHRLEMKRCFESEFMDIKFNKLDKRKFPRPNQIDSLFWKTEGFTPLHFAARYDHEEAVRELIGARDTEVKPNLLHKDQAGFLAFDWMEVQNKGDVFLKACTATVASQGSSGPAVDVDVGAAIQQASCVRKMTDTVRSNIAEEIAEEKKAMEELQHAWESGTRPRFTMRVWQWLMHMDEENKYLKPKPAVKELNIARDVDAVSALMMALRKGRFWWAKEIVLLEPAVVLDHGVAKKVKELRELLVREWEDKECRDFVFTIVRNDRLAGASNLLRWMLPWAQSKRKEDQLHGLVDVILDRPELKKGFYEDRQVYLDCANAILVGAALIGGVAFQAWLQPPLGYTYDYKGGEYADVHNRAVRMFWRFNSAAFFLSVATLIAGAKGAVPVAHDTELVESVEKVKRAVAVASTLLGMALVCVVVTFVQAGVAAVPPIPSDLQIMRSSAVWGSFICTLALLWFSLSVLPLLLQTLRCLRDAVRYSFNPLLHYPLHFITTLKATRQRKALEAEFHRKYNTPPPTQD